MSVVGSCLALMMIADRQVVSSLDYLLGKSAVCASTADDNTTLRSTCKLSELVRGNSLPYYRLRFLLLWVDSGRGINIDVGGLIKKRLALLCS